MTGAMTADAAVDGSDTGEAGEASPGRMALQTSAGDEIKANSLRCIYRQSFGAAQDLSLQLQYLSDPEHVAFAVYVTDPVPETPFEASPEATGRLLFEAVHQGSRYEDYLTNGEVTIQLESLPAPSTLSSGDTFELRGSLQVAGLSLPKASVQGQEGGDPLELTPVTVAIGGTCGFQLSQVVN